MRPWVLAALALAAGCGAESAAWTPAVAPAGLHGDGLRGAEGGIVSGARLLPMRLQKERVWTDPGGSRRSIVGGVRVAESAGGAIVAAADRLPAPPTAVVSIPERMGGGFLFALGPRLWRADAWLAPARAIFDAGAPIAAAQVGLDRAYVWTSGAIGALDPRSGRPVDLGPLPATPRIARLAALDAWRAVVVADGRGAMLTLDAGSTWRPLDLPIDPGEVLAVGDVLALGGSDGGRFTDWWEVRADGQVGRRGVTVGPVDPAARPAALEPAFRLLGERPLAAAVEDGWPLSDGTAVVARDGALARVRLADGAVVEVSPDAFPLRPARCHPLPLPGAGDPSGFGFACGEPRGRTVLYRFVPSAGRLEELRRWAGPREVLASGQGSLAVRGPCDDAAVVDEPAADAAWCLRASSAPWRELRLRGPDVARARLVVLGDGRAALVRGPEGEDLSTARLTLTDGETSSHVPLKMPDLRADVARALRTGVWMDGFGERRPGVLGGWIDVGGPVLGIEIDLDGTVRVGELLRDAGAPFVAGRFGLGWTASRRGFETTDGGMTWRKDLDLPEPIAPPRDVEVRACGPVGCLAAGWIRVGWGSPGATPAVVTPAPPPPHPRPARLSPLDLVCEPVGPPPPAAPPPRPAGRLPAPRLLILPRRPFPPPPSSGPACAAELSPFEGRAGPAVPRDDCGLQMAAQPGGDRAAAGAGHAQLYAWGPKGSDWGAAGKWAVAWIWPWGGWRDARSSPVVAAPWDARDDAAKFLGLGSGPAKSWTVVPGEDPDHALLLARPAFGPRVTDVLALEAERAPIVVRRTSGEILGDVLGAVHAAGQWVLATPQSPGELPATVLWVVDGATAREAGRVSRVGAEGPGLARIARRTDTGAVGVIVDGQLALDRGLATRWVLPVDLESGTPGEPEALAPLAPPESGLSACTGDDAGWLVDLPYPATSTLRIGPAWSAALPAATVRARLSRGRSCIERLSGSLPRDPGAEAHLAGASPGHPPGRMMDVGLQVGAGRQALRCSLAR